MNRTDRLVAMVMHLQGRRLVRAEDMARHFEVSIRTVYRDIAALGEAGVPIAGEAGVGYSLVRSYHLPPVMLTADEAAGLFVGAELARKLTDASVSGPVTAALDKLRAVLPPDRRDHVERLAAQTVVVGRTAQGTSTVGDPSAQPWLMAVQRGVAQRRVLRLRYRGAGKREASERAVEPLGVVFYGGSWYLVAWCRVRQDLRHFRVDRIQHLEMLAEPIAPRPGFSLARHLEEEVRRTETVAARVWFAAGAQERAKAESYATLVEEERTAEGAVFSLYTYSLEWLGRWLLSFGADAAAIEPEELRGRVCGAAEATLARHREWAAR
jgi:predicted DNA-binding transcriptional regulator YafY